MMAISLTSRIRLIGVMAMALAIVSLPVVAQAQKVLTEEELRRLVALEKVAVHDGVVTGEVHNKAGHPVREVQLFVRYTWLWDDERHPGVTDPGTSTYYTLKETIQSGDKIDFTYKPSPPLPKIAGGRFETSAKIAGFTEIIPQK